MTKPGTIAIAIAGLCAAFAITACGDDEEGSEPSLPRGASK